MYSSSQHKYSFYASHMKTYLDHEFDEKTKKIVEIKMYLVMYDNFIK